MLLKSFFLTDDSIYGAYGPLFQLQICRFSNHSPLIGENICMYELHAPSAMAVT